MTKKKDIEEIALNDKKYYDIVEGILNSYEFQKRKKFKHHEDSSVYHHCLQVSYGSYKACKKMKLNYKDAAIGGLLHDFYETPWQDDLTKRPFLKRHGFMHARNALENAFKFYSEYMNDRIANIILRHMFPLNICPPKYPEAWIVSMVDKKVSLNVLASGREIFKYVGLGKLTKKK